ncbi:hypothetical protein C7U92_16615 [Bradyrhizobium sp. WBOS7]|jgi:hypothetical protein|uniref:Uncharacterized protein n=1 Tax=Bradyrhizobium betae TaxID=244734 RepID=A0AAE9N9D3_9BRAD|nr:hypothetical protein [Bradyrhizobium sp. WBOS2]MDD1570585.1 hypothetical protein [Bradyrhizobium sp. WBOS1]MDD1578343.1 hypothetical protein [Bradyrhizobium sp. WBOS7]MDD1601066.1 hypothetical protein [Bradyrhizobium sp. WBOS16]UUO34949.1 hypothetical protein DCK84_10530 [Bradyrhizobium sp. WBOS01]UUO41278.1 hypothetical protein DCM75_11380 [Bradyrhizobium sp. WBOS02]UUO55595.1 hypothetical protein DCM79_23075 [Bradyrhizobium sp. WBOS07]UUO65644.1 hypothetical protein DCM83_10860 [Bradyrh
MPAECPFGVAIYLPTANLSSGGGNGTSTSCTKIISATPLRVASNSACTQWSFISRCGWILRCDSAPLSCSTKSW